MNQIRIMKTKLVKKNNYFQTHCKAKVLSVSLLSRLFNVGDATTLSIYRGRREYGVNLLVKRVGNHVYFTSSNKAKGKFNSRFYRMMSHMLIEELNLSEGESSYITIKAE